MNITEKHFLKVNTDKYFRSSSQPTRTNLRNDASIFTANHIKLPQKHWVTLTFLPSVMTVLAFMRDSTTTVQLIHIANAIPTSHLAHHSSRFSLWQTFAPAAFSNYYLVRRKVVTQTLSVSGVRTSGGTVRSPSN